MNERSGIPDDRPGIRGEIRAAAEVSGGDRDAMLGLLTTHFEGVSRAGFDADLAAKSHVLLLRDRALALVGFSTLLVYESVFEGATVRVVCSGDTIVDPSAWGSAALPREWIAAVRELRAARPELPYYWLLISSGFRTYRLLSTFWQRFDPSPDRPIPDDRERLLDHLARERFGDAYDAATGIVRFAKPQRLRPHLSQIPSERARDPHVAYFLRLNPGHADGDELATLCELTDENLSRAGRRVVFGPPVRDAEAK